jgi:hypothetical protein
MNEIEKLIYAASRKGKESGAQRRISISTLFV